MVLFPQGDSMALVWDEISVGEALEVLAYPLCSTRLLVHGLTELCGSVWLREGRIYHAEARDLEGEQAAFAMLCQPFVRFEAESVEDWTLVPHSLPDLDVNALLSRWTEWLEQSFNGANMATATTSTIHEIIQRMIADANGGILALDVFDRSHGLSVAGFNSNPRACALFNGLSGQLVQAMSKTNGLMGELDMQIIVEKNSGAVVVVELATQHRLGMKVDTSKCSLGLLLSVVLPDGIKELQGALG